MARETEASDDFLVGDEVVSVTLNHFQVELLFTRDKVMIGSEFTIYRPDQAQQDFVPSKRLGSLSTLWLLIGCSVTSTHWDIGVCDGEEIEIMFDDGSLLRIPPATNFRGTIIGQNSPPGVYQIEDF